MRLLTLFILLISALFFSNAAAENIRIKPLDGKVVIDGKLSEITSGDAVFVALFLCLRFKKSNNPIISSKYNHFDIVRHIEKEQHLLNEYWHSNMPTLFLNSLYHKLSAYSIRNTFSSSWTIPILLNDTLYSWTITLFLTEQSFRSIFSTQNSHPKGTGKTY